MRERLIALRERRAALLARAEAERSALSGWLARADRLSHWASTGASLVVEIRRRPLLIAAAVALLFALRPKRVLGWVASGWSVWRLALRARVWWRRLAPAAGTH